jgi:hypothetical protein
VYFKLRTRGSGGARWVGGAMWARWGQIGLGGAQWRYVGPCKAEQLSQFRDPFKNCSSELFFCYFGRS